MGRKTKHNSLTTPELINQINQENKILEADFLDYLKSLKRSPGTIAGYKSDLDIFFVWVLQNLDNKSFANITKRELVRFQNWLIENNENSSARIRRIKSAISSLSNYIENILDDPEDGYDGFHSIIRKIESPALQPVREKTVFEDEDVDKLLDMLIKKKKYKQACAVALAMFSGRRKAEIVRFRVSDFNDDKLVCDGALYKSDPIQTKGRSGGKFIPCYVLAKDFKPYLDLWLNERKELGIESEWLFPDASDPSKQLGIAAMNSWAKTFSKMMDCDYYWHMCRHRFTTYLVKAGIPDTVIAEIVSWSDTSLVKLYTDIEADEQIAMYFKNGEINVNRKNINEI